MTAEQLIPSLQVQLDLISDPLERKKVFNWILGVIDSQEQRKKRLHELLDNRERYQIKKKNKKSPTP